VPAIFFDCLNAVFLNFLFHFSLFFFVLYLSRYVARTHFKANEIRARLEQGKQKLMEMMDNEENVSFETSTRSREVSPISAKSRLEVLSHYFFMINFI
jgi:hypothetical protein